jgi:probable DNA metabolism protein
MNSITIFNFEHWRDVARSAIIDGLPPSELDLKDNDGQATLFGHTTENSSGMIGQNEKRIPSNDQRETFHVGREFISMAQTVGYHRSPSRWNLLYRLLWRLTHGEPQLLQITTDDDVLRLQKMEKEVRRDTHKMKAFVRFRKVTCDGEEYFIAWYQPDHRIVRKVAPFFSRRFKGMNWTILTPHESVVWDQVELRYGKGVPRRAAPDSDELEQLWKTYYANIFNPARVKIKAMKAEMPVRFWSTLPEAEIISELLVDASTRVEQMIGKQEGFSETAQDLIQRRSPAKSLDQLFETAKNCDACDLYRAATQIVFGSGPENATLVLVGEQPGDQEDLAGEPFVGPAGKILNDALSIAGIERNSVYLTNMVKHFKHQLSQSSKGKRRLHQRPNAREIRCCRPWFDAEWNLLANAQVLVCLGATAAKAIIGPDFRITKERGKFFGTRYSCNTLATWHPSAILRTVDSDASKQKMSELVDHLRLAKQTVFSSETSSHLRDKRN